MDEIFQWTVNKLAKNEKKKEQGVFAKDVFAS